MSQPFASFRRRRGILRGANGGGYPPLRCNDRNPQGRGLSSVSLTAPLCEGSRSATLPAKPPLKGEVPAYGGRRGSSPLAPQGRGGSVSRRDHNQAAGTRVHLTGGTNYAGTPTPNASRSSGERGLGGEVLLSEKQPLPPEFLTRPSYNIPSFDHRRRCAGSERASRLFRSWSGWGRCRDRPSRRAQFARSRRLDAQRK